MNESFAIQDFQAVAVGASAGAVDALSQLLPFLAKDFPLAILIVVHLPPDKESTLASLLSSRCAIAVKEAEDKESIRPGTAYLAPPNYHLLVEPDFTLSLSVEEPVLFSRPSIDVMFESAADAYGDALIGVIMSGSNSDGARGLRKVEDAGGLPLVQDPADAAFSAMPEAALHACANARPLKLSALASLLSGDAARAPR